MNLKELQKEIHETAKEKGWWDQKRSAGEIYALIHSEISEAVEEARLDRPPMYFFGIGAESKPMTPDELSKLNLKHPLHEYGKPEGELIELADVVIRILDWCEHKGWQIDLDEGIDRIHGAHNNHLIEYNRLHTLVSNCSEAGNWSEGPEIVVQYISDICDDYGWDLWQAVRIKMDYNKTRPVRHGGKKY